MRPESRIAGAPSSPSPPFSTQRPTEPNKKPEAIWPVLLVLTIAVEVLCMFAARMPANAAAAVLGVLGAIVFLGFSRARETQLRADGRFTDWGFMPAAGVMNLLTLAAWSIGIANVFFLAKEFTR